MNDLDIEDKYLNNKEFQDERIKKKTYWSLITERIVCYIKFCNMEESI